MKAEVRAPEIKSPFGGPSLSHHPLATLPRANAPDAIKSELGNRGKQSSLLRARDA